MSDELLPYYNRELAFLRQLGAEFAETHPKIAGRLRWGPDGVRDPHVERLIEAFAQGATLGGIGRLLRADRVDEPAVNRLTLRRRSEPFERLRRRTDDLVKHTGARPKVFLANLGPRKQHAARAAPVALGKQPRGRGVHRIDLRLHRVGHGHVGLQRPQGL